MSYNNFGRGRGGFAPQGTRAGRHFGRPRFPRPPFRYAGPPRPGHPFGMPWQSNNMFFQSHSLRGSPQFRSDGRRRRFCSYDVRFPAPPHNRLPVPLDYEEAAKSTPNNVQIEINQDETVPQLPLLGSEEERQQKITETADRLKQKLSSFSNDEMTDLWNEDLPSGPSEDNCIENRCIPIVGYKSSELNLTYNDLKDIGRINPDNMQHTTDVFNITNNTDSDVMLDENENGSHLVIPSDHMTNLENVPDDNEYMETDNWELQEAIDNSHNLEQLDSHGDNNIENELLEPDLQPQYDTPLASISQDDQQQDTLHVMEAYPADVTKEQDDSETLKLQAVSFPIESVNQDILQKEDEEKLQNNEQLFTNSKVQRDTLNSHPSVNNVALDDQLPVVKENSFHSGPPHLSPHTEELLPVDFDPTTPPPKLLKQEQPCILPPYSIPPDLPPLFDPTAPPPNITCLVGSNVSHEDANPAWSSAQNPMPAVYQNIEVHTSLNTHGGFILQQLPLEISNQNNAFLPPHVDSVNFSPIFPMPSGNHSGINSHVPSMLPQMHATPHNTYISPSSLPVPSSSSDLPCSVNKDDCLDDMQEAMKFAKEMTSIIGKTDEESKLSSKSLSESDISVNSIGDVEFIALPPGKPKVKTNKIMKKMKEDDTCNKKKTVAEEQTTADHLSSEEMVQDANVKSKDVSLMKEQDRPKVIFNLNNKTKMVNPKTARQESNEKRNGMTFVESEKPRAAPSVIKKNLESTLKRGKEKEKNLKKNGNNSVLLEAIANQDATLPHKKPRKDVRTGKPQCSSVSLFSKIQNIQKPMSYIKEKNENSNTETSWKNKIISRFLKMSKNDIYNMVNNTSLRKFDIIMKRLVKEKRSTLSLEMRHAQDEKMKLYDQQEFMKQLNAMLDTDAIVSITDLPTEFIHHLNEVLQLDVQPDNHAESAAASSSQYDYTENTNYLVTLATECANKMAVSNDVSQECARTKKSHTIKTPYNKNVQEHTTKSNDFNFKDDTCNTIVTNNPSDASSNLLTLQHDLDDIFSEVTKKNQTLLPAAVKERKRYNMEQQNTKKLDVIVGAISKSIETEAPLEDDGLENCPRWDEKCDRWKRKEREDIEIPHAYRNLTKEEWEARYGAQANPIPPFSTTEVVVNNKKLSNRGRGRKLCSRRRFSSESSKHPPNTRHRSLEKDKHKKSRRHSDDRGHSTEYLEDNINHDSNTSSSSSSSSSSTSSDSSDNTNVTKLLRVIKENEKVAKKMSLSETIRDEVNAEIERERKSRKSQKNRFSKSSKSRKQKKARHKKKKRQSKKTMSSSDSSLEEEQDNNEEATDRLLTESEIKKEILENQVTQETIIKEELDIGQDEHDFAEFASASSLVVENKAAYLLSASQNSRESPSQEIPIVTQLHTEDRLPTASPTQPKTKAQLKQMPETSDMNDNKVTLNVFTCIPEDWSTLNLPNLTEDLNRPCETTGIACSQDKAVPSAVDSSANQNSSTVHAPCGEANRNAALESSKQNDNKISATDNDVSGVSVSTVATSVSSVSSAGTTTRRQGASKKIDIKTYYERTIQRRMNEKLESKRPAEDPVVSTREAPLTSKITEPEVAVNKSAVVSAYSGISIQDPRLISARSAVIPCTTNSKNDVAQTASGKDVRQKERQMATASTIAELPRRPEEKNSNRIVDSDSVVKKINQDKSKDKVSLAANNINVLSNVVVTYEIAELKKLKKSPKIQETAIDMKSQSKVPSDPKRFKNIRSEGSKELKLKKELAKEQKAKKKAAAASKSPVSLVSTKVYVPSEDTTRTGDVAQKEKKIDDASSTNKTERMQLIDPRESKVNDSNVKTEPSTISSGNPDDELPRDKAEERSPSFDILGRENAERIVSDVEGVNCKNAEKTPSNIGTDARSSKTTRSKGTRYVKRAKNVAGIEIANKKDESAREICNVPGLDVPTASKTALEAPENQKDLSMSEVRQSDTAKDTELPLNHAEQSRVKKSNNRDLSKSTIDRDVNSIAELDVTPRSDSVGKQSKEGRLLTDNIKSNDIKESNTELDVPDNTEKSASANENKPLAKKIVKLMSAASNENSQQGTTSSDSTGSPFKGFLQEAMMDFEQPLFDLKLNEIDGDKKDKVFLDDCNVNYATCATASSKDTAIEGRQDYETLEPGDYASDANTNANENFNITFRDTLLPADKECTTSEKSNKSGSTAGESGEGHVRESPSEIITATLHDEDNDINIGGGGETEGQLMSKEGYASCAELVMKGSMFINEEEIIQGETQSKDLASKLKTTTDPSLSDALEATISDDALRLPEGQSAEHLDNHMYLEANISAEKTPGFDSDEHLDNIFYLDERLRDTATFDNKDDEEDFPVHEQSYDITPTVSPEATMIAPCADLSKPEECKFDLKHISSTDNDLLAGASNVEHSSIDAPRTLNIPTKAALKEANLFSKSPSNVPTATKEVILGILDKIQQSEADLNCQTPAWNVDGQNNIKTCPLGTHNGTIAIAQDLTNVNTMPSTQDGRTCGEPAREDTGVDHGKSATPSVNIEKRLHGGIQLGNPVVELRKMKELDKLLEKKKQESSTEVGSRVYESQSKRNGTILHKLKDKRQMKRHSKKTSRRVSLVKRLEKMRQSGRIASTTREAILARMLEIDLQMHKLATEKLKLHEILRSNVPLTENSVTNSVMLKAKEDDTVVGRSETPSTLTPQLPRNGETTRAKEVKRAHSSPKRKRTCSRNSDDEVASFTPVNHKTKMPVIRWKKKPRLERIIRQEKEDKEEENLDETTEQQAASTSVNKKVEDPINASQDTIRKAESNTVADRHVEEAQEEKTTERSGKEAARDIDSKNAICSAKSVADKSTNDRPEWKDLAEGENTERAGYFDIDKPNDILASSEAAKVNSQPLNKQVHSTPESLSIYSDDSTWDSLVQNTASEMHENRKAMGLALLDETLKKEQAWSRKMKAIVRKKKKKQLDSFLRTVNSLTMEEEELPLSKLYIRKLQQKRDLLDSLSQKKKDDADLIAEPNVKNADEVMNENVAENRGDLCEPQLEARASDDIPATSDASPVLQSDKHQFYVDAEANANSDWPCREKENEEVVALPQENDDVPGTDGSNHVFKAVSQDKASFYHERNVEPDSSVTPEETLMESHSSDCERDRSKDANFDIKVSVPKTLIKDDFSLGMLQKLKSTEAGVVATSLVDSTTNVSTSSERSGEEDKNSRAVKPIVEEDKKDEKGETKDKHSVDANEREETVDSINNAPSAPQSSAAKSGYSDVTENEESGDSVASNRHDKTAMKDTERDLNVSDSTVEKTDAKQKKSDTESEQLSNDAIALKRDCQSVENAATKEEEKSNPENKSHAFERILDHDQSSGSSVPTDLASERSEESNEASVEQKSGLEHTLTSTFAFNQATLKGEETSKKVRRKHSSSTPVRRSTRNSNENIKSGSVKEAEANSNSSERELTVLLHEKNLTTRSRSKSPTQIAMRDEIITNNGRKNRVARKVQNAISRKVGSAKSKTKIKNPVKHVIAEFAVSKNNRVIAKKRKQHAEWQVKNCKVRLVDCKSELVKYVNPEVLDRLGIIAFNPCTSSNSSSFMQHTISNRNTIIPNVASGKSFFFPNKSCDKATPEIKILEEKPIKESSEKDLVQEPVSQAAEVDEEDLSKLQYTVHKGPILDIKVFENSFLAASEDSKIYRYSQMYNGILNIYKGHKSAVTCLYICKSDVAGVNKELMYSGSLDGTLRCYNITTGELVKNPAQVNSPIQCMDQGWGIIFIGTKSGHVSRFHIKTGVIKGSSIAFSDKSVLALKATNEGPRRILIVASRNQPITIRDAQTGLFLRTISGQKNHITVYSLLRHDNLIYCGTSSRSINVFDFTTGEQVIQYDAGVGIVCMRLYKQLLFAGCYDGNIYVFNINNHNLVCSIRGPGNMLLSIEVVNNKIIAGSKDKRLHSWQMPTQVRALL